ncbi:hypothetical protein CTI12_AA394750 [Artemisia annua]|uniref:Uncharacterized protein n=1 Tax=Artemisia annua TaxID=35608 RepID=A0A2U1MCT1_ARTAN|nr:hypothetical protein CTI12_AA394750 [Artemisia annua]
MNSSNKLKNPSPAPPSSHHHHHQCLEVSPNCPQHSTYFSHPLTHLQLSPACPLHGHLLPHCPLHSSNTASFHYPPTPPNFSNLQLDPVAYSKSEPMMMQDMHEEDDDVEFTYVLTDEWKEFFAKSEAKRRLAKKEAKKKGKN